MKMFTRIMALGLGIVFLGVAAVAALLIHLSSDLPQIIQVEDYKPLLVSEVYDRNGEKVGEFFREKRILTPFEKIPKNLVHAFVAAEDSSFFDHHGINFVAIFRAVIANIKAGRRAQGASTITQQVAKSLMLTPEKTYTRKIKEMILAYRMESHLSKEEILYLYLNQIYFGQGAYGVTMASQIYFRKPLNELQIEEMALLAGLPQAPTRYSPIRNAKSSKARQRYVLRRMASEGFITDEEAKVAAEKPIKVFRRKNYKQLTPYYLETVRQMLVEELGETTVLDRGIKVYTAMDLKKQLAAQEALEQGLRDLDKRQGYRGPLKNIESPGEQEQFLEETRQKIIAEKNDYRIISPDGTFTQIDPIQIPSFPENIEAPENLKKFSPLPNYVDVGDIVDGIVVDVDDKWGLVRVRYAEGIGIIDFETMKWAREPNPNVRYDYDEIKKPSQALKKGDVIRVKVTGGKFFSHSVEKEIYREKQRNSKFERPASLSFFKHWTELQLDQEPIAEAALVSFDQETSDIVAMVGGYDFSRSEFNRALQSARQTGSAFKAIVYASAMDKNYTPASLITDAPIVYEEEIESESNEIGDANSGDDQATTRRWKPSNHSKSFNGEILFRNALIRSLNVPTVKILQDVGIDWVADYSRRLGIFSPLNMDFTLGLGSSGVTLYEVTKVFSQFGRLGQRISPLLIHKVVSKEGEEILSTITLDKKFAKEIKEHEERFEERRRSYLKLQQLAEQEAQIHSEESQFAEQTATEEQKQKLKEIAQFKNIPPLFFRDSNQLIKPQTAYLITSLLQGTVAERGGTGGRARALGRPVAAKTGTTNGYYDGWFMGYTPQIATGVWVGFDQERSLGRSEVGARNALPIWLDYMKVAHENLPVKSFAVPSDIIFANIDNETGKLASASTKSYVRQAFVDGTEPQETSDPNKIHDATEFYKQDLSE